VKRTKTLPALLAPGADAINVLWTGFEQAPPLTSIMCESSRRRVPAGTNIYEHHVRERQVQKASRHLYSRASSAKATKVECRQASIMCKSSRCRLLAGTSTHEHRVREQQRESASRHLYSRAACARATGVECRQALLLTIIMCESGRCRVSSGTSALCESSRSRRQADSSTHKHHAREQQM